MNSTQKKCILFFVYSYNVDFLEETLSLFIIEFLSRLMVYTRFDVFSYNKVIF
jgi:hypothetical protein